MHRESAGSDRVLVDCDRVSLLLGALGGCGPDSQRAWQQAAGGQREGLSGGWACLRDDASSPTTCMAWRSWVVLSDRITPIPPVRAKVA